MRSMAKKTPRPTLQAEAVQLPADSNQSVQIRTHNDAEHTKTQNRMDELERKMKDAEKRLEKGFQEKFGVVQAELRQTREEVDGLKGVIENMKTEMKQLNKQIEQLSKDCDGLRQSLAEKDKILKKTQQDQEVLQKELDLKSKELEKIENERKRLQVLLDEKTGTLKDFMGVMGNLMERMQISDDVNETKNTQEESNNEPKGAQAAK